MTEEEYEELLDELEADVAENVQAALTLTAREFATAVNRSTELTAAAFSVSRIREMWRRRVPGIMNALRRVARRGVTETASDLDETPPTIRDTNERLAEYTEATEQLLNAVGDRLARDATRALSEGVAAGETLAQLKDRMTAVFSQEGSELGPTRAQRIAATETTRAFNAGTLAAAQALTGDDRPLVKQWQTRRDERVRQAHKDADGQLQLLSDPFTVGGRAMQYPGDPSAPADLTINCRCIMRTATAPTERTASMTEDISAAAEVHTGAMVALIPSAEDAARLALEGGEDVSELHVTLMFLGEASDWDVNDRAAVLQAARNAVGWLAPVQARAFGVAHWNPQSDSPVWVYSIGDDRESSGPRLADVQHELRYQIEDIGHPLPEQHSPWAPHVTGIYDPADFRNEMTTRLGPVNFDRVRVAFAGEYTDFPLIETPADPYVRDYDEDETIELAEDVSAPPVVRWSTPGATGLAFENQQTGDGRIFAPGALYWEVGPWPLQYAGEMLGGHDGAELAGAIEGIYRDGDRISGGGVLYLTQPAGSESAMLLAQGAPLGVSVDLDDVDLEMVDATPGGQAVYRSKLLTASLLPTDDGGYLLVGETPPEMTASDGGTAIESRKVRFIVSPEGTVPGGLFELDAAAGDPDVQGDVIESQRAGEYLLRITRGRIRGATLVTIPAYANARIVLDDVGMFATAVAPGDDDDVVAAASQSNDYDRVLRHVRRSNGPVGAARVAQFLKMPIVAVQRYLARAASRGEVVRIARGLYTDRTTSAKADHTMMDDRAHDNLPGDMIASVTGAVDLPVADRDTEWDGDAAATRVFEWADGDTDKIGRAFAYRDDDANPATKVAYKLGYADVMNGELVIIPRGVSAALGAMNGARGGVDLPADERDAVRAKLEAVAAHVAEETGEDDMEDMQASAWAALADLPPMPAAWFAEPTEEELPPGGPGVNYSNGRIFGWVAQAGEPHAGFAKKITIDTLGRIDTAHFLRQRFTLDDGSLVKAGAYTMNVGHHRDGAECETSACQFDDTRTVAGIVTVGMNERGMWFSGAAAPWLSEWDRAVFKATQPSYHMKKGPAGNWQLRAVLAVPVPGHSSPLLASAVVERAQLALTAAATMAEVDSVVTAEEERQEADVSVTVQMPELDYDRLAAAIVVAQDRADAQRAAEEAELAELLAEARTLAADSDNREGN